MAKKKQKTALVTGSSGFIGSHLCEKLDERGYKVVQYDIKHGFDVGNRALLHIMVKMHEVDVIFNLAGLLGTHELIESQTEQALAVIVGGTLNCLKVAQAEGIDFVEASKPNLWLNTYSIAKQAAEDFTLMYHKEFGLNTWIVKWFNVFGPRQHYGTPQKLAPTAIVKALLDEPIPIFGDGGQTADHIYVEDAAHAAIDIYESKECIGDKIEVGSGEDMPVEWFVDRIISATKSKSQKEFLPMRRGEDEHAKVKANTDALIDHTGYAPRFEFSEALEKTIKYYVENLNEITG